MTRIRKRHPPEFKLKAVIEVIKGEKTSSQLAGELGVHPIQLSEWKKRFLENGVQIFEKPRAALRAHEEEKTKSEI